MPATYSAVFTALDHSLANLNSNSMPKTLLDAGAGTGAGAWAAHRLLDLQWVTCLEREDAMRSVGQAMMKEGSQVLSRAKWIRHDLSKEEIPEKADLVNVSYVLNEMTDIGRAEAIKKLQEATQTLLLIVEPGTPVGFSHILKARDMLLKAGAHLAAPCPHDAPCPMDEKDWCHFTCRVNRARLHRQLKGGEAPFEDEKFVYLAVFFKQAI